jgi:hypothetical protein
MAAPIPLEEPVTRTTRRSNAPGPVNDATSRPFTSHLAGDQVEPGHSSARGSQSSVSLTWSSSGLFSSCRALMLFSSPCAPSMMRTRRPGAHPATNVRVPTNRAGSAGMRSGAGASHRQRGGNHFAADIGLDRDRRRARCVRPGIGAPGRPRRRRRAGVRQQCVVGRVRRSSSRPTTARSSITRQIEAMRAARRRRQAEREVDRAKRAADRSEQGRGRRGRRGGLLRERGRVRPRRRRAGPGRGQRVDRPDVGLLGRRCRTRGPLHRRHGVAGAVTLRRQAASYDDTSTISGTQMGCVGVMSPSATPSGWRGRPIRGTPATARRQRPRSRPATGLPTSA